MTTTILLIDEVRGVKLKLIDTGATYEILMDNTLVAVVERCKRWLADVVYEACLNRMKSK